MPNSIFSLKTLFGSDKAQPISTDNPQPSPEPTFYWLKCSDQTLGLVRNVDLLVVADISLRSWEGASVTASVNTKEIGRFATISAAEQEIRRYIGGPITNTTEGMKLSG